jgi:RNA polymerase sigma factor (sigma-70 family)
MDRNHATDSQDHGKEPKTPVKVKRKRMRKRPPLTPRQQSLALHYLPLARSLARPLKRKWPTEVEEFESAACLALVEAAQSYDHSRRVKFGTYARFRIMGALRDVQRRLITAGSEGELEKALGLHTLPVEMEELGRPINTRCERPVHEKFEAEESFDHWLRKLPKQHATACREIYHNEKTQIEVARMFGCSKTWVSYLLKQSIKMLSDAHQWKHAARDEELEKDNDDHVDAHERTGARWPDDVDSTSPTGGTTRCLS